MPTYLYRCSSCKKEHEVQQKMSDQKLTTCPHCNKEALERVPTSDVSLQFKGSGFYKTDYSNERPSKNDEPPKGCHKGSCGCK